MRPDELALLIAVARVVRSFVPTVSGPERAALDEAMKPFEPRPERAMPEIEKRET
jgi:hypothetical protein